MGFLKVLVVGALFFGAPSASAEAIPASFNDAEIQWFDYRAGLEHAEQTGKPVFVLVHATWCPVCQEYRKVFFDPSIVELSNSFVFVLIDQDREKDAAKQNAPDGSYIPRSMFLSAGGVLQKDINSGWDEYLFFLDPSDPDHLRRNLRDALQ